MAFLKQLPDDAGFRRSARYQILAAIALQKQMPIDFDAYFEKFPRVHPEGDIKRNDEPDDDLDGISLVMKRPMEQVKEVVKWAMESRGDRDLMAAVAQWAKLAGEEETKRTAMKRLWAMAPLEAIAWMHQLKFSYEEKREVMKEKKEEEVEKETDFGDVKNVIAMGRWKGIDAMMSKLPYVKKSKLRNFGECYRVMKELGASEEQRKAFVEKGKEFFFFFDEYVLYCCCVCFYSCTNWCGAITHLRNETRCLDIEWPKLSLRLWEPCVWRRRIMGMSGSDQTNCTELSTETILMTNDL